MTNDPRHEARKLALGSIFGWLFSDIDNDSSLEYSQLILDCKDADINLAKELTDGVEKNIKEIDDKIVGAAPEWPLNKISKVDLVILRIAIFELLYRSDTPKRVAIDEAIELAKDFGSDTSSKFVNGVLGNIMEKYVQHEQI
ncbi:MAG: N utilization substance protein B-like protein [candidate division WWE3 bacterium GW2011_GWA1_46_21]|uniref:Transcription antitermination protein NusB n=4 Tax=Katanobacteria TaxID=422282 RepID=A0A0G1PCN6_UNCKA|nr:MAG: N utilization substance protein B-like protein [candidate division WWE3 bacterium GW2011_GWA1_46_21]KKU49075.1 MAG: N utilization substance protein B-like protein [candidate division WWE3 bacterium GW2011_GWA2_46_9]KKU51114.1 MAG: N utilization substance protein B-like protein [candidate division WWE3 bacterium GW2011_GWC1_47_10]KKU57499.1 MAG: N utilization substance protein B-like protein [candidate division WWE3 bacterium GW2011_GWB1_47_11]